MKARWWVTLGVLLSIQADVAVPQHGQQAHAFYNVLSAGAFVVAVVLAAVRKRRARSTVRVTTRIVSRPPR